MRYLMKNRSPLFALLAVLAYAALVTGCAPSDRLSQPAAVPEIRPGVLAGYLPPTALPNSLALISPPPAAGSAAFANDEEASRKGLALRGTPRWTLAIEDANLRQAAGTFSCAVNAPVTEQETPRLYILMRRASTDAGRSTSAAKDHYSRPRPFMINKEPICTPDPDEEDFLRKNGSYPSGHAAIGWAWALILTEIAPERTDAILARGRAFGESRVICNVHWQSDVVEGRFMGAGTVARLHADATFRADLEAAKAELAAVRAKGLKPQRDCAAEAATLAK